MKDIHFYRSGTGGAPFVFQHGLAADLTQARKLFEGVNEIDLLVLDCPGHGRSKLSSKEEPSFQYYSDQVRSMMDHQQVDKAFIGGISMGSGIALNIALAFPERVMGLVLVRPAWLDTINPANLMILKEAADLMDQGDTGDRFKDLARFKQIEKQLPLAAKSIMGVFAPTQNEQLPKVIRNMVSDCPFEDLESLKGLNVPCLVIGNDADPLHPFSMAETIHQLLPNSQVRKVTSRYLDDPQHQIEVRDLVSDFVKNF